MDNKWEMRKMSIRRKEGKTSKRERKEARNSKEEYNIK